MFARTATAIVGEYAKRIWFRKIFKDSIVREREELEKLKSAIELERHEYRWAIDRAKSLHGENETLLLEVIRLRVELSAARQTGQNGMGALPLPPSSGRLEAPPLVPVLPADDNIPYLAGRRANGFTPEPAVQPDPGLTR